MPACIPREGKNILKNALYDLQSGWTKSSWKFMGEENYAGMQAKWADPLCQKKKEAGKAARTSNTGKGKAVYTGGSVSTMIHQRRLISIVISDFLCSCVLDLKTNKCKCVLVQVKKRQLEET